MPKYRIPIPPERKTDHSLYQSIIKHNGKQRINKAVDKTKEYKWPIKHLEKMYNLNHKYTPNIKMVLFIFYTDKNIKFDNTNKH